MERSVEKRVPLFGSGNRVQIVSLIRAASPVVATYRISVGLSICPNCICTHCSLRRLL